MPALFFRASLNFRLTTCYARDRKSTRLNSSHSQISYAVFCLKKKKHHKDPRGCAYPELLSELRRSGVPALLRGQPGPAGEAERARAEGDGSRVVRERRQSVTC